MHGDEVCILAPLGRSVAQILDTPVTFILTRRFAPRFALLAAPHRAATETTSIKKKGGLCVINLMKGVDHSGPVCALFRVYRPSSHSICPDDELPKTYFIKRKEAKGFDFSDSTGGASLEEIKPAKTIDAFNTGKRIETTFCALIQRHMKPLKGRQLGTQFFHPNSVAGLFVNANATYVIAFKPPTKTCIRMKTKVPKQQSWRCYYGVMAIEYESTNTLSSKTFEELGGWGTGIVVYAAQNEEAAAKHGYDKRDKTHHLLTWKERKGACGLVLRYLHYFEDGAMEERSNLIAMNGGSWEGIEGVGKLEYF